jgi:predicted nucleic acid-binding protein
VTAYLDASALVKIAVEEAESGAMRAYADAAGSLASSRLASAEVRRALLRRYDADPEVAGIVMKSVAVIEVDAVIVDRAGRVGPPELRTLDAIHLASALDMGADLEAFVTYDARLAAAARDAGLTVVSPGAQLTGAPRNE